MPASSLAFGLIVGLVNGIMVIPTERLTVMLFVLSSTSRPSWT